MSHQRSSDYVGKAFQIPVAPNSLKKSDSPHKKTHFSKSSFNMDMASGSGLSQILQTQNHENGTGARGASQISAHPTVGGIKLRSVEEIPRKFQQIFTFPYFNLLQSKVYDEVLYTDNSIVVSAPTGSGKTVVFELALIRLLMKTDDSVSSGKIIYMAPMKALCSERFMDWKEKFSQHGMICLEVTGDTEIDDLTELFNATLIFTTPEKWDSMSRRWKDNRQLFRQIKLFLIDEVHTMNDRQRGATVEAVVSRMKTLQTPSSKNGEQSIRFIAVSATMPNYNDIAAWLSQPCKPALAFSLADCHRSVKLERIVIGYPFTEGTSDFRFDMRLSYRLKSIIDEYSHSKPTLVFCSSRKSVIQSAEVLARDFKGHRHFVLIDSVHLQKAISSIHDYKVAEFLQLGIGIHHAGLHSQDRHIVEELFRSSQLPVLVCTSTLAMGVNLPAHLVIIKSTHYYNMGAIQEYSDMHILQMIGRAGRPQFDTFAVAVIMTKSKYKSRYESLVNGRQLIESSLHKHLIEHLNAEIVLQTISNYSLVMEWLKHTFLYVRALKNPKYYGLPSDLKKEDVEKKLTDMCLQSLNQLRSSNLVSVNEESDAIFSTDTGKLMARYCVAFNTIKQFHEIAEHCESIADMLTRLAQCSEFEDIQLRTNEKKILNTLNKDKNKETIRYPMTGKIKTGPMKVNCLIQAQLSCLIVSDFSLSQDTGKIFRVGQRLLKCLMEFLLQSKRYSVLLYSALLYKAFKSKLWFDSKYVARQLDGIGPTMSLALANAGLTSFQKIEQTNARDIELIVNRHPPFGNQVLEAVSALPKYQLALEQMKPYKPHKAIITLIVDLLNFSVLEMKPSSENTHQSLLIVGDAEDKLVLKLRIFDSSILRCGSISQTFEVTRCKKSKKLDITLISQIWVGLDIYTDYEPIYSEDWFDITKNPSIKKVETPSSKLKAAVDSAKLKTRGNPNGIRESDNKTKFAQCSHKCLDKSICGHKCCKTTYTKRAQKFVEDKPAKLVKVESSAYFNKKISHDKPIANLEKRSTKKEPSSCTRPLRSISTLSKTFTANQVHEPVRLQSSVWDENASREADEVCFDLLSHDDFQTADSLTGGNKHVNKADLQEEEIISASKSSQDLDITKNGWADLDAFKLSRQELYQNGRPPHLLDNYCIEDDQEFVDSEEIYQHENFSELKSTDKDFWMRQSSSDEELCRQMNVPSQDREENIAESCICEQNVFTDTSLQQIPSERRNNFLQRHAIDSFLNSKAEHPLLCSGGKDVSFKNSQDYSLSHPMSPVIEFQPNNYTKNQAEAYVICSPKKSVITGCGAQRELIQFSNHKFTLPSDHHYDHLGTQHKMNLQSLQEKKFHDSAQVRTKIFNPQSQLPLEEHPTCGLFDGIF
ncbi:probable ATP-dependent DNA helicase HFM1 [Biomphalaria glabrata]|uniref:DNA 3'-5' helicase n=1 Tax=Biomphalaria glabrata TaxID=6526 RepID=A0A9W2YKB0_BIOGL|nr:probable ATP-dependent DNA helicase HFM1 [Biomphalaria glabrata]